MKRVLICLIIILSLSLTSCKKVPKEHESYKMYDFYESEYLGKNKDYKYYKVTYIVGNRCYIDYYRYDKKSHNFELIYEID